MTTYVIHQRLPFGLDTKLGSIALSSEGHVLAWRWNGGKWSTLMSGSVHITLRTKTLNYSYWTISGYTNTEKCTDMYWRVSLETTLRGVTFSSSDCTSQRFLHFKDAISYLSQVHTNIPLNECWDNVRVFESWDK